MWAVWFLLCVYIVNFKLSTIQQFPLSRRGFSFGVHKPLASGSVRHICPHFLMHLSHQHRPRARCNASEGYACAWISRGTAYTRIAPPCRIRVSCDAVERSFFCTVYRRCHTGTSRRPRISGTNLLKANVRWLDWYILITLIISWDRL